MQNNAIILRMQKIKSRFERAFEPTDGGAEGAGNGTLKTDHLHLVLAGRFAKDPENIAAMQLLGLPTCENVRFKRQEGDMPQAQRIRAIHYNKNIMLRIYGPLFLLYKRACEVLNVPMVRFLLPPAPPVIDLDGAGPAAALLHLAAPAPPPPPPPAAP